MSGRVSKLSRHRRQSVARRAAPSRTLSSHHLIPSCSAAYPHPRRHLSKRAVFGSSFDAHAVIAPPRRTPGRNAISCTHHGNHPTPRPPTSTTRRKTGRGDSVLALLVSSLIVPCIRRRRIPPRRGFPSRGGGNSRGGHIFRTVFLSSSYPPRLIASSVPRLSVPSGQASRQGKTAGGYRRFSPPSSYPSPVSSSPRLAPRVGVRGEERLVPVGSVPSSCSCVPASFAVVKAFQSFLGSPPQPSASKQSGRPVPVPPLVSAGGAVSSVSPSRLVHSSRGTGRGSAVSGSSSGSLLMEEGQVLGPSPLLVLFCCGSSANRSYRPCSE